MKFISLCSGIEAASVAFGPLGWTPLAFSEIEPFPCAVLRHHYPDVPNLGDMTRIQENETFKKSRPDVICGGTPCQSFSIAGKRAGLDDPRGNLALHFLKIVDVARPRWVIWENVPGVLSNNEGRDFAAFLGELGKIGYGWAYRVLDAQYFGVPQSRDRVFVVGYLGNWTYPAAVLFERESLQGNFKTGKKKGEEIAATITGDSTTKSNHGKRSGSDRDNLVIMATGQGGAEILEGQVPCLNCNHEAPIVFEDRRQDSRITEVDKLPTLTAKAGTGGGNLPLVMAFKQRPEGDIIQSDKAYNISTTQNASAGNTAKIQQGASVRRLTPMECERAQGFPDNYTRIPYKGKAPDKCPDRPRYKAIGNSWAVPCARWIGERIDMLEKIKGNK